MWSKIAVQHAYVYLVLVQKGLADNVLTDGRGWGQTVEPIEELHARNVLLSSLCVQLTPQNLRNPLGSSKKYWNYLISPPNTYSKHTNSAGIHTMLVGV